MTKVHDTGSKLDSINVITNVTGSKPDAITVKTVVVNSGALTRQRAISGIRRRWNVADNPGNVMYRPPTLSGATSDNTGGFNKVAPLRADDRHPV